VSEGAQSVGGRRFPAELAFRGQWRDYQSRLLDSLDHFLSDRKVHIVAAPGSGKTILGLELARLLDRPTLVLAPTLVIRNQWLERLTHWFLPPAEGMPAWVSIDLAHPAFLTVSTYQALHQLWHAASASGKDRNCPAPLRDAGFETIILDEAHHLRSEWQRVLEEAIAQLGALTVLSLTGTPPRDVPPTEWDRYQDLCGPIDAEISIPELVASQDLCPHQDLICLSLPDEATRVSRRRFQEGRMAILESLRAPGPPMDKLEGHPWIRKPDEHLEEILEDPAFASSLLVFLHARNQPIPGRIRHLLGVQTSRVPPLDPSWANLLLQGCLHDHADRFPEGAEALAEIQVKLRVLGAIEHRRVNLLEPQKFGTRLIASPTKMAAAGDIVAAEAAALGHSLRMVILTDYIREEEAKHPPAARPIGVLPLFNTLLERDIPGVRMGTLTGPLVILPSSAIEAFQALAQGKGLTLSAQQWTRISPEGDHVRIDLSGPMGDHVVALVTSLFELGHVNVLVGTAALLGEGWDAPCINSLILATTVGSYMLSNQMRGRAIRTLVGKPGKTANIWHLACVDPGESGPGQDLETLRRRFGVFLGIGPECQDIRSGLPRMGLGEGLLSETGVEAFNTRMFALAKERGGLHDRWDSALKKGVKVVSLSSPTRGWIRRKLVFRATLGTLLEQGLAWGSSILMMGLHNARVLRNANSDQVYFYISTLLGLLALGSLPRFLKAFWLGMRHHSLESSLQCVGLTLVEALKACGSVEPGAWDVRAERDIDGGVRCWLEGASRRDGMLFASALGELLDPIENPRYILCRSDWSSLWRKRDFQAVPEVLGRRKESAEAFAALWRRHVGPVSLVYTRTSEGRRILLMARHRALSTAFQPRAERLDAWR